MPREFLTDVDLKAGAAIPLGSAAAPGMWFSGDNTGLYSPGADQVGITTGGTERLRIDSSGQLGIATSTPLATLHVAGSARFGGSNSQAVPNSSAVGGCEARWNFIAGSAETDFYNLYDNAPVSFLFRQKTGASSAANVLNIGTNAHIFYTNDTERMRIDSSGQLLVGTSAARSNFFNSTLASALQVEGAGHNDSCISLIRNNNVAGSQFGPYVVLGSTGGTTVGSNTVSVNGGMLGAISFQGSDGSEFVQAAEITAWVDATPGANDMPGRLVFSTTADGAASPTERMRIDSSGRVLVGTSSNSGGSLLQVNDNRIRVATAKTPASATDTGTQGEICWDASYIYVCTATNTWKRAALSTW